MDIQNCSYDDWKKKSIKGGLKKCMWIFSTGKKLQLNSCHESISYFFKCNIHVWCYLFLCLSISAINIKKLSISLHAIKYYQKEIPFRKEKQTCKIFRECVSWFENHRSVFSNPRPQVCRPSFSPHGISFSRALLSNPLDSSFSSSFLSTRFIPDPVARGGSSGCQPETSLIHPVPALCSRIRFNFTTATKNFSITKSKSRNIE